MERYGRSGEEGSRSDQSPEWTALEGETNIEASMRRLGLRSGGATYPERPDEPDCIYYLRTGSCGYGSRCRFNHPRDRGAVIGAGRGDPGDFPERVGQPVCQYFMRTGTCKFGASCKYNHPRQGGGSVTPMSLNYMGYPLRPGEKECSYYMRTGQCKFGATCRFHHPAPPGVQVPVPPPPPAQVSPVAPHAIYPTVQSPSVPSSQQYGVVMARPPLLPGSYVQSPYGPMVLPPGMVPYSGWNPYPASVSAMPSPGTQPSVGSGSIYGITPLSPSAPAYTGPYQSGPSSVGPSSSSQKENMFPQRPGQPECQYYMRTGDCKFGSSCRYHHPLGVIAPKTAAILSPIGLPIRPGAPPCSHFAQHGICKFGPACKFDHSLGSLSYSPSASSLTDIPVAPYPVGSSVGTLAPSSSSSSDLRPELISTSTKETSSTKPSSSTSLMSTTTSGPVSAAVTSSTTSSSLSEVSPASASASVSSSGLEARPSS